MSKVLKKLTALSIVVILGISTLTIVMGNPKYSTKMLGGMDETMFQLTVSGNGKSAGASTNFYTTASPQFFYNTIYTTSVSLTNKSTMTTVNGSGSTHASASFTTAPPSYSSTSNHRAEVPNTNIFVTETFTITG